MYGKLGTLYGKKWHQMREEPPLGFGVRHSLCGYLLISSDKFKSKLKSGDELCQTCMMVRAHSKQKLNRHG